MSSPPGSTCKYLQQPTRPGTVLVGNIISGHMALGDHCYNSRLVKKMIWFATWFTIKNCLDGEGGGKSATTRVGAKLPRASGIYPHYKFWLKVCHISDSSYCSTSLVFKIEWLPSSTKPVWLVGRVSDLHVSPYHPSFVPSPVPASVHPQKVHLWLWYMKSPGQPN